MNERDFVYWLNGFIELSEVQTTPSADQWQMIKDHLALVMTKVTPNIPSGVLVKSGKDHKIEPVPPNPNPFRISLRPAEDAKGQWLKDWLEQQQREINYPPLRTPYPRLGDIYC